MALRIKDDDDVLALHEMYWADGDPAQGMSFQQLSLETGIMEDTIRRHFKRLGLPTRGVGQRTGVPQGNVARISGNPNPSGVRFGATKKTFTGHRRRSRY